MKLGGRNTDHNGQMTICVSPDCPLALSEVEKGNRFVVVKIGGITSLWAKIKFVGIPQSENCINLTDSSPLMGEKCPFTGSIVPFLENSTC